MKNIQSLNRRQFLQAGVLGSAALATSFQAQSFAAVTKAERDPFHGLKLGITSYTFRNFTLDQAIAMTKQAGVKYISLKAVHLPLKSTAEGRQEARKKIEAAGLVLMGGGVVYMPQDAQPRDAFEYAKDAGMPTIVCAPIPDLLDDVEKLVKEYDIRIALHNHGPGNNPYPSPLDALRLVKDRDPRMGICLDVGHTVRIGVDPVSAIQECAGRLFEFHIKDVNRATSAGGAIAVGRGVIDLVAVLKALVGLKFNYHVALEYEVNESDPMPGVRESIGYMRGVLATID